MFLRTESLDSPELHATIHKLACLLKSSIGPGGHPKLITTSGGHTQVTSLSSQIVERLEFQSPLCIYIAQVVKSLTDCGLYTGVIVATLMEQLINARSFGRIPYAELTTSVDAWTTACRDLLESVSVKVPLDFASVHQLLPAVRSILESKSCLGLTDETLSDLALQVTKAFLLSIDEESKQLGRVVVIINEGSERFQTYPGMLYQVVDWSDLDIGFLEDENNHNVPMLLFSAALTDNEDVNHDDSIVQVVLALLQEAVLTWGLKVVACQKSVDPSIQLMLRRKRVICLERLGADGTTNLAQVSGAVVIADVRQLSAEALLTMRGTVSRLSYIAPGDVGGKAYVALCGTGRRMATLVASHRTLADGCALKVVLEQALCCLREIACSAAVLPGAGCFEVWLCAQLQKQLGDGSSQSQITNAVPIRWLQTALLSAASLNCPFLIDSVFLHAWPPSNDSDNYCHLPSTLRCRCGFIDGNAVEEEIGSWTEVTGAKEFSEFCAGQQLWNRLPAREWRVGTFDSYTSKRTALLTALETFVNLAGIGLVVYKSGGDQ